MSEHETLLETKKTAVASLKKTAPLERIFHEIKRTQKSLYNELSNKQFGIIFEAPCPDFVCGKVDFSNITNSYPQVDGFSSSGELPAFILETVDKENLAKNTLPSICDQLFTDPYELFVARWFGFDTVTLYPSLFSTTNNMMELFLLAKEHSMECMLNVGNKKELEMALNSPTTIIGLHENDQIQKELTLDTITDLVEYVPENKMVVTRLKQASEEKIRILFDAEVDAVILPLPTKPDKIKRINDLIEELNASVDGRE
jgi:indole-3-glycerol phosphate synthase